MLYNRTKCLNLFAAFLCYSKRRLKLLKTKSLNCIWVEWINTHVCVRLKSHVYKEWNILSITYDLYEARSVRPCSGGTNCTSFLPIHRVPGYQQGEVYVDTKKHSANPRSQLDPWHASASCDLSYQGTKLQDYLNHQTIMNLQQHEILVIHSASHCKRHFKCYKLFCHQTKNSASFRTTNKIIFYPYLII